MTLIPVFLTWVAQVEYLKKEPFLLQKSFQNYLYKIASKIVISKLVFGSLG